MITAGDYLADTLSGQDEVRDELRTDSIGEDACETASSAAGAGTAAAWQSPPSTSRVASKLS